MTHNAPYIILKEGHGCVVRSADMSPQGGGRETRLAQWVGVVDGRGFRMFPHFPVKLIRATQLHR